MTENPDDFDLKRTVRVERGRRLSRSALLLSIAIGIGIGWTVVDGSAEISRFARSFESKTPLQAVKFTAAAGRDHGVARFIDRIGTGATAPIARRIETATVMLIVVGDDWLPRAFGSGTLLADHEIDGRKAIATIMHVGGGRHFNDAHGLRLVAVAADGAILGVVRPLARRMPESNPIGGRDQPELLGFDPHYRIDSGKLASIRGVQVAPEVTTGIFSGDVIARPGVGDGVSGGGWYDAHGRLIAVAEYTNSKPKRQIELRGDDTEMAMVFRSVGNRVAPIDVPIETNGRIGVQGLGAPMILAQLCATAVSADDRPRLTTDTAIYRDATGFGYPSNILAGWHADLRQVAASRVHEFHFVASFDQDMLENTKPSFSGRAKTDTARMFRYITRVEGDVLRQVETGHTVPAGDAVAGHDPTPEPAP